MSAGAIGGILGAGLARSLGERYGKAAITLYGGLFTMGVAFGLAIVGVSWLPAVTEKNVVPIPIHVERSSVHDSTLTLWSGGRRFTASSSLWRPGLKDQALTDAFAAGSDVTLWMQPGHARIFGFDAGVAHVAPGPGVDRYMRGRSWFRWIWTGMLALGAVVTLQGARLKRGP